MKRLEEETMPRIKKTERILNVLGTVAPLSAQRLAQALGVQDVNAVRVTLAQMQREGRVTTEKPSARELYESRGRVQHTWRLNRHQQPGGPC